MSPEPEAKTAGENGVSHVPSSTESNEEKSFSWLQPHPIFVIIFVGPDEQPFGIQKDFLCHRSGFYRNYFDAAKTSESVENVVRLPETPVAVFGMAQNFLYTGKVDMGSSPQTPSYESLIGLWNLGHKLEIDGLCDQTLEAMVECRRLTESIPATPLLIQVWEETPEGSSIRTLLLSWAAEYMRSSELRAEFAKSLPQEVLSELVVTMSSFDNAHSAVAAVAAGGSHSSASPQVPVEGVSEAAATANAAATGGGLQIRKNVHYLEEPADEDAIGLAAAKRNRRVVSGITGELVPSKKPFRKPGASPPPKVPKKRSSAAYLDGRSFSTQQKLDFCADLLTRMLSGPGFWTRLVGPFRDPVDPAEDGVPDYWDKIKKPMDLGTVKAKMDRKEYTNEEEFLVDIRQIFENCFTYWKRGDLMWTAGERLQKTFEEKYSNMNKWISKMGGEEGE